MKTHPETPLSRVLRSTRPGRPGRLGLAFLAAGLSGACGLFGGGGPEAPTPAATPGPALQENTLGPVAADSRLYSDNTGGYTDSARIVIRDAEGWVGAWDRATSTQANPLSRPTVDFGRSMVLVVAAGRMTPEDQIRVDSVGVRSVRTESGALEDVFEVVVRTVEGCGRLQVEAFPFEIVRTRRFEGEVRFIERRSNTEGCER